MPSFHVPTAFVLLLLASTSPKVNAAVPCNSTHNPCEELLWKGSQCKHGYCTNPFQGGCLTSLLREEEYAEKYGSGSSASTLRHRALSLQRVCNSEDSKLSPFCQPNADSGYSEVRIFPQNWETSIAASWILQIILSELLDVPTTLETGIADKNNNFYSEENRMDYGNSDAADKYASFQNAFDAEGGDCRMYKSGNGEVGYVPCAHSLPETWNSMEQILFDKQKMGVVEKPSSTGVIGINGWFITKFSVDGDNSLGYYFGYQGNQTRQKLAERFKRPTTWKDYCSLISTNNCSATDEVADRAPAEDGSEDGRYFVDGSYTGHFRATDKNNCTKTKECTGHFMDYPCGWKSYFKQQAYHLGIALESNGNDVSGGYAYSEMVEIWKAANATKSDVIGQWWKPEATFNSFVGTESELIMVTLPAATAACIEARTNNDRCDGDRSFSERYGDKEGACAEQPTGLLRVVVGNMQSNIEHNKNPKAAMSPAYDLINSFQLTELHLDQILLTWSSRGIDPYNFDMRFVACKWVADNLEDITKFIPQSHPRTFTESSFQTAPISISAMVISALAIIVTVAAAFVMSEISTFQSVSLMRSSMLKTSQIEFVNLLLVGLLMVPVGALLMVCKPSNGTCISWVWLINVGYTLMLVPTLVRVSAIIHVIQEGNKFRRVTVDKKKLLRTSLGISAISAIFCALWTGLDPVKVQEELSMTNETNDLGETVVTVSYYCKSESDAWFWVSFIWQCLLLVSGSVLAFQMRSAPKIVNDSKALAFMIYSSSIFLILRIVLYILARTPSEILIARSSSLQMVRSLLWSLDSMVNTCIYFSKFLRKNDNSVMRNSAMGNTVILRPSLPVTYEEEKVEEYEMSQALCSVCGSSKRPSVTSGAGARE